MTFPPQLAIPTDVLKIARKLEDAGFETWCVGGAIRDNLLGLENHDFDLTTAAAPADVQKIFQRTVPVGIEHGTVAVLDSANRPHEVTTFRKDIHTDGRHAVVEFGVSLMDDLARRDFTINAIAYHPIICGFCARCGSARASSFGFTLAPSRRRRQTRKAWRSCRRSACATNGSRDSRPRRRCRSS
ncbi:MAG: hypothetical protein AUH41_05045 [Gemmatimonadetes bacterium 13_1_40CM_66_11]|nr:MAG: hypothetical protein AUH41_05045 [Gemmatimonadetes bacterium 13_1_40CM_66_11]